MSSIDVAQLARDVHTLSMVVAMFDVLQQGEVFVEARALTRLIAHGQAAADRAIDTVETLTRDLERPLREGLLDDGDDAFGRALS